MLQRYIYIYLPVFLIISLFLSLLFYENLEDDYIKTVIDLREANKKINLLEIKNDSLLREKYDLIERLKDLKDSIGSQLSAESRIEDSLKIKKLEEEKLLLKEQYDFLSLKMDSSSKELTKEKERVIFLRKKLIDEDEILNTDLIYINKLTNTIIRLREDKEELKNNIDSLENELNATARLKKEPENYRKTYTIAQKDTGLIESLKNTIYQLRQDTIDRKIAGNALERELSESYRLNDRLKSQINQLRYQLDQIETQFYEFKGEVFPLEVASLDYKIDNKYFVVYLNIEHFWNEDWDEEKRVNTFKSLNSYLYIQLETTKGIYLGSEYVRNNGVSYTDKVLVLYKLLEPLRVRINLEKKYKYFGKPLRVKIFSEYGKLLYEKSLK